MLLEARRARRVFSPGGAAARRRQRRVLRAAVGTRRADAATSLPVAVTDSAAVQNQHSAKPQCCFTPAGAFLLLGAAEGREQ